MNRSRHGTRKYIVLLASFTITLVTLLVYANALDGAWVLDDYPRIVENEAVQMDQFSLSRMWEAATSPPGHRRWITNASFALNYYVHGLNPVGYQFVNLAIHLLTALGLFFFLVLLLQQLRSPPESTSPAEDREEDGGTVSLERQALIVAWTATLLWAIHPVLTQAINYTTQRGVLLTGLFYVWGLWAFLEWMRRDDRERWMFLGGAVLLGMCAVMSKEIGATFVLAAGFVYGLSPGRTTMNRRWIWVAGVGCVTLFGVLSFYLLGGVDGIVRRGSMIFSTEPAGNRRFSVLQRVMTEWRVMLFYLSLLFYPGLDRFNIEHDIEVSTGLFAPVSTGLSLLAILGLLVFAYRWRKWYPLLTFVMGWFFLQLMITSSVINLELIFEHRVYLAAIGPIVLLVDVCYRHGPVKWYLQMIVLMVLVGVLGWTTHERNKVWQSTLSVYRDAVRKAPQKPRNQGNLGVAYAREARRVLKTERDLKKAFNLMSKALRRHYRTMSLSQQQDRPIDRTFTRNVDQLLEDMTSIWSKMKGRRNEPEWTRMLVRWHQRFLYSMPDTYIQNRSSLKRQLSELRIFLAGVYLRRKERQKAQTQLKHVIQQDPERVEEALEQIERPELRKLLREQIRKIRGG
jgi:hypothetical protein